jgi:hypothetical protein
MKKALPSVKDKVITCTVVLTLPIAHSTAIFSPQEHSTRYVCAYITERERFALQSLAWKRTRAWKASDFSRSAQGCWAVSCYTIF